MEHSFQKPHGHSPDQNVSHGSRIVRHAAPVPGETCGSQRTHQFIAIAPVGHASTQAPQSAHASTLTSAAVSPSSIAPVGQTVWQTPQSVHAS